MKITQIRPRVFYVKFDTQYDACLTMLRMQEFYESPYKEIRGKYFTLEEYMDRYAKQHKHFDYDKVWNGFNIPKTSLDEFFDMYAGRFREKEHQFFQNLVESFRENGIEIGDNYYIIAGSDDRVVIHETAHAYYYLNSEYKKEMNKLLELLPAPFVKKYSEQLLKLGYDKSVLKDELQAYFVDSIEYKKDLLFKAPLKKYTRHYFNPFSEVFKKYDSKKAAS